MREHFEVHELDGMTERRARQVAASIVRSVHRANCFRAFVGGLVMLLSVAATAAAQNRQTDGVRAFVLKGVFYTSTEAQERPGVIVTAPGGGRKFIPAIESKSPLDGGMMGTEAFAEAMKKLEAEGKVKVTGRASGVVRVGGALDHTSGPRVHVGVEEYGDDGKAAWLTVNVENSTDDKDGRTRTISSVQTTIVLRVGQTVVFVVGTPPGGGPEQFFALSLGASAD